MNEEMWRATAATFDLAAMVHKFVDEHYKTQSSSISVNIIGFRTLSIVIKPSLEELMFGVPLAFELLEQFGMDTRIDLYHLRDQLKKNAKEIDEIETEFNLILRDKQVTDMTRLFLYKGDE